MLRILTAAIILSPAAAMAIDRPIPSAQSATVEIWFAGASLAMIVALYAVHRLVTRR